MQMSSGGYTVHELRVVLASQTSQDSGMLLHGNGSKPVQYLWTLLRSKQTLVVYSRHGCALFS